MYILDKHKMCTKGDAILNNEVVAKKLIMLRGNKSRKTVADSIGISVSALAMYEQGERIPRDNIKIKLASYYGRSVSFIFFTNNEHEKCT